MGLIYLSAFIAVGLLVGIICYVAFRGVSSISWQFLSTIPSTLEGTFGILGNIVNTLYIIVITLIIATPIGIGAAVYLTEYAKPGKIVSLIEFTTETLAGIPYYLWFVWYGILWYITSLRIFNTLWFTYSYINGTSYYYKNNTRGT